MLRSLAWAVCVLLLAALPVSAEEVIDRFISSINVMADGTLDVTEDITVLAEGRQIRRGIIRDFPTDYVRKDGTHVEAGFTVKSALHNGVPVDWRLESAANGVRVRMGNADRMLQPGFHTFTISYETTRQIGFFADHDELYWNVTGNGWSFPINEAIVNVTLPAGAVVGSTDTYTGRFGSSASNAKVAEADGGSVRLVTTAPLQAGEGFTIAVTWQKGIVAPPSPSQQWRWWLRDNASLGVLVATLAATFAYYFLTWTRIGRDPPAGTIVPLFKPPGGLDPAAVRFAWQHSTDNRSFAAAVVNLAVKGALKIEQDGRDYRLIKRTGPHAALSPAEQGLLGVLPGGVTGLDQKNHRTISAAMAELAQTVDKTFPEPLLMRNLHWFVLGAVISAAGLLLAGYLMPAGKGAMFTFAGVFSALWWGVVLTLIWGAMRGIWKGAGVLAKMAGLFKFVFLIPFMVAGVGVPLGISMQGDLSKADIAFFALAAILAVENIAFYKLLPALTRAGRQVADQIEGFRLYLTTAEEKRLDALNPPEKTPELFERYLPYAMALDCENQWNEKFAKVLAAAAAAGATAPIWYGGSQRFDSGGFAGSVSRGLASSISSASTPPGTSSGSHGGGFSGGGGGGGGGSGW